jgi:NitT/TauT family transport system ATP-binding protein
MIGELLAGHLPVDPDGTNRTIPGYLAFHADAANVPWSSQALWVYSQMVRWGQVRLDAAGERAALDAFRPDLYREVFGHRRPDLPMADARIGGTGTGPAFDPADVGAYVGGFAIRHSGTSTGTQPE